MKPSRLLVLLPLLIVACDAGARDGQNAMSSFDSLRQDSLVAMKNDLLNEVMTSAQFINEINAELSKARALQASGGPELSSESEMARVQSEQKAVVGKIQHLVARLDSVEGHVATLRQRAQSLSKKDAQLVTQVAEYEKTIQGLRATLDQQGVDYKAIIDKQNEQIALLQSDNVRLAGERAALSDTVGQLTVERNTAYYIIGTKDELVDKGVLVEEGGRRFLVFGGRDVEPARALDPASFTRIDKIRDRVITLPDGEYKILSRQDPTFVSPFAIKDGKLSGGLRIDQPDEFWRNSRFLILVKS